MGEFYKAIIYILSGLQDMQHSQGYFSYSNTYMFYSKWPVRHSIKMGLSVMGSETETTTSLLRLPHPLHTK